MNWNHAIRLWWTSTHQWVVSWGILLPHLTQLCTIPEALNLDPPGTLMLIRQMIRGFWDGAWRVGARFQPKNWEEQLHNKWELALRPPCHQSKKCWRLFSQLASLSCRFGMIEPDHGTGCEHQPIEFRRVSRMQKLAVLTILETKERACQIILPPLPSALSTRWCNSCSYIWDAVAEAQFFVRVLLYINSIYNYTDVDRPPGIERYWKPCSLLKSMKLRCLT